MNKIEDINTALYMKMTKEQTDFIQMLKQSTPEIIIEKAYEIVMREDILLTIEEKNLTISQVKQLLRLEKPLESIYQEWLSNDCSYMEMLQDTINDFADKLEKQEKKKSHSLDR